MIWKHNRVAILTNEQESPPTRKSFIAILCMFDVFRWYALALWWSWLQPRVATRYGQDTSVPTSQLTFRSRRG
jgi:hypothetical protein